MEKFGEFGARWMVTKKGRFFFQYGQNPPWSATYFCNLERCKKDGAKTTLFSV